MSDTGSISVFYFLHKCFFFYKRDQNASIDEMCDLWVHILKNPFNLCAIIACALPNFRQKFLGICLITFFNID